MDRAMYVLICLLRPVTLQHLPWLPWWGWTIAALASVLWLLVSFTAFALEGIP